MTNASTNEAAGQTIHETMVSCIEEDRAVKASIIEMLPDDFVGQMKEHLEEEKALYKKYKNNAELPEGEYERVVAGRIFEVLNYLEYQKKLFDNISLGTPEWERAEDIMFVSATLCKIARYPDQYGLKEIDIRARIPDGVYTGITKEGNFHVYALAEAKLGALGESAFKQIRFSGSRTTMANIVEAVQRQIDTVAPEDLNPEIAQLAKVLKDRKMEVKWDTDAKGNKTPRMGLEVLVPTRGASVFDEGVLLGNTMSAADFANLEKQQRVKLKTSCFNTADVHKMTKRVMELL